MHICVTRLHWVKMKYHKLLYSIKLYFPIQLRFLDLSETFVLLSITFALPAQEVNLMIGNPSLSVSMQRHILPMTHPHTLFSVRSLYRGHFSLNNSRKTPHISPVRARYGEWLASAKFDRTFPTDIVGMCAQSCCIWQRYIESLYHRFALPWRHTGVMASHITGNFPVCPETKDISKRNITGPLRREPTGDRWTSLKKGQ